MPRSASTVMRPHAFATGSVLPLVFLPGIVVHFTRTRNCMECPDKLSGVNIPCPNVPTGSVSRIFLQLRTREDEIPINRGRRRRSVVGFREFVRNTFSEIYFALIPETRIQFSRFGI